MEKIDSHRIETILSLTPLQEGILFHYLQDPQSRVYFEQLSLEISGDINKSNFEKAWNMVIKTNEMLRTLFRWEKLEKPTQVILKEHPCALRFHVLPDMDNDRKEAALKEIKSKDRSEGFDLTQVPFRVTLCRLAEKKYEMIISNHHILYDGWSNGIILKEFFNAYHALCHGKRSIKPPVKSSFKDFIKWLQSRDRNTQEQYWRNYLADFETPTALPIKGRPERTTSPEEYSLILADDCKSKLENLGKNNRFTLAPIFYTAWGILLQKYCGSRDVIFGTTVSGRSAGIKGIENMVGLFINTVPLRVPLLPDFKLIDLIAHVEKELQIRKEFEYSSLVNIKNYSPAGGSGPLFDTIVAIENYPLDKLLLPEDSLLSVHSHSLTEMTHYDLAIAIILFDEIKINFSYHPGAFAKEVIENLAQHFECIIRNIVENAEQEIKRLEIVSEKEKKILLYDFNEQGTTYPGDKTIHQLFQEQVERTPTHMAYVRNIQLTYQVLDERSDCLARELTKKGITSGDIVGIIVEHSNILIVGILGILKVGAAYLPINPKNSGERTQYMMKDSGAKLLITDLDKNGKKVREWEGNAHGNPSPANLAYIIYTSGSTGNPKGVPITHANLSPLLHWGYEHLGLTTDDRSVQNLPYYFDWSVWEIFITLTSGAALYMVSRDIVLDAEKYAEWLNRCRITVLHITPTHWQSLSHGNCKLNSLQHLCIGAEKLTYELLKHSYERVSNKCRIYNMYGPTETTIMAGVLAIESSHVPIYKKLASVPIGKTIANNILSILDHDLNLCPVYVPGELYIGGEGLSTGYLNNPGLTIEKFVPQVRQGHLIKKAPRLYRTGDLAYWLPDGNVVFLGRIDFQVKIRGFRIEPGEIENRLLEHEAVKDALVICRQYNNDENYLCAYVVLYPGRFPYPANILKNYLSERLPDYMIPSYIIELAGMPLNANGKVDINALPDVDVKAGCEYIAPRDRVEEKLAEIFNAVLNRDASHQAIGIDDSFFELGGHSLNVTALVSRIHKELKIKVPFTEIFVSPTVRELALYMAQKKESRYGEIPFAEEKNYYPLSPAQKRLLVLHQVEPGSIAYNIQGTMIVEGVLEKERFEKVFLKLIARHESLRTSFTVINEEPVQRIHREVDFKIAYVEGASIESLIRPFDLSKAPLLRVGLIKQEENVHLLVIDMHHIIADGTSMGILIKEFTAIYRDDELPPPVLQYKDFSQWYNDRYQSGGLTNQKTYWLKQFAGEIPLANLPVDFTRPVVRDFEGAHYCFDMEKETIARLKTAALEQNTTLYVILIAIYAILLSKLSGQDEIVIGTPVIGRKDMYQDIADIIGMFVNTLALRVFPLPDKKFSNFVKEISRLASEANENQEYPFEDLVENILKKRDAGRNPVFDVMFAMQNMEIPEIKIPGLTFRPYHYDNGFTKFDLTFICQPVGENLSFMVEYSTKLFKKETIQKFAFYFKKIIMAVLENEEQRIAQIEIIPAAERQQVLTEFNHPPAEYPQKTVMDLIEEQVVTAPHRIACFDNGNYVTYKNLNDRAGVLAQIIEKI